MTQSSNPNLPVIFVVKTFETSYTPKVSFEESMMTTCESVRPTSSYSSAEEIQLQSGQAKVVHQRKSLKDLVSRDNLPPTPAPSPSPADTTTDTSSDSADDMPVSPTTMGQRRTTRDISRGLPGEQASDASSHEQRNLAKQRSQYYEDTFASREPISSARERISRESLVMADVRTNVIIQDEYTFTTDLSAALSTRYQRPESSILVTVAHSACLLFGGSFDPAYTISITALQSQLQPATNKRNASLIQKAMEDTLGVIPARGIINFMPIAEENMATNGKTVAGEIENLERENSGDSSSIRRTLSRNIKRQSTKSLRNLRPLPTHDEQSTPPSTAHGTITAERVAPFPPMPPMPTDDVLDRRAEKVQKMSRRKSFIGKMFGKGGERKD